MRRSPTKSKQSKQRVYRQPFFSPESSTKLKKGVLWFGLGFGSFFAALPGMDAINQELDARLGARSDDLASFHGELSQPCISILADTAARGYDMSTRTSIVHASGICDADAVKSAKKLSHDTADVSANVAVPQLIVRDTANNNAVDGAALSKNVISFFSAAGLIGMTAATAFGLYGINAAVAEAYADKQRYPSNSGGIQKSQSTSSTADNGEGSTVSTPTSVENVTAPNDFLSQNYGVDILPTRIYVGSGGLPVCLTEPCPKPTRAIGQIEYS